MVRTTVTARCVLSALLLGLVLGVNSCESDGSWVDPPASPVDASEPASAPTLTWEFDGCTADGITSVDVYLTVNGTLHPVFDQGSADYREIGIREGRQWGVPADRLTACASGDAGDGDVLYVVREGRKLAVYRATLRKGRGAPLFKRIKTIAF